MKIKNEAPEQSERLHMRISPEEITAIDDWRFANRVPSRSEAVRRLVQIGSRLEPELEPIFDLIRSQLERHKALYEVIDGLVAVGAGTDPAEINAETEEKRAKLTIRLMKWADESWTESTELYNLAVTLMDQYLALGGADQFADALRIANETRSKGERQRALWKARSEYIERRANSFDQDTVGD